jgi:hypothetical protein
LWLNSPDLDAFPLFPPPSRHYRCGASDFGNHLAAIKMIKMQGGANLSKIGRLPVNAYTATGCLLHRQANGAPDHGRNREPLRSVMWRCNEAACAAITVCASRRQASLGLIKQAHGSRQFSLRGLAR